MGYLQVDTEVMAASASKLANAIEDIDAVLALLRGDVNDMLGGWSGEAASAHGQMHRRFDADAQRIHGSLVQIYDALIRTHATYVTQESQQQGDGQLSAAQIATGA